jgi:hypothetical protein
VKTAVRQAATAFTIGAVLALVLDAVLQFATGSIRLTGGMVRPWWVRVMEHGVWVGIGVALWLASSPLGQWIEDGVGSVKVSRQAIWNVVGLGFMVLPVAHVLGQWIVLAVQFTLSGTWGAEGRIFLSTAYYGNVLLAVTPWMGAGAILRGWARHLVSD